ncbi:phage tail protein [Obesumbacterium proteus]|uniref:phage tail protein n=1 Tax=Obesumbacterium proteus TaxID=82983 RepID=UPI001F1C154E|nr:phage tail protein [Obesumbacterium proteus]MCE9886176.1 phage tail protein [Obesumbacterium proteus]MCE9914848.1 phage tail protein [Obesumbacterium proteus]MCE9931573.1 phage tail protein [Obesumbacterium proteus]MCG2876441.1 phage tail protein [Obesumbacterium proteus]
MADDSLNIPVIVRAVGINASSIPISLSPAYSQYILSQATDFTNVAGKANEAGQGAYDAQVKNDEQDVELADHEGRITANTNAINLIEVRLTTAEGKIVILRSDVDYLLGEVIDIQADIVTLQDDVTAIQEDYVSKSATANQTIQPVSGSLLIGAIATPTTDKLQVGGSENVSVSYKVAGLQVVGARQTGWTAATGTAYKGTFDANQAWTVGMLNVLQIQEIANSLTQARQRIKALEDALRTHGQIN